MISRASRMARIGVGLVMICGVVTGAIACNGKEGVEPSSLPDDGIRADYVVFAQRCSKCHSLSRPLNAGIQDDAWWELYVTRMRRQPSSGISENDQKVILRFLHYYSQAQQNKAKASGASANANDDAGVDGGGS
jgi:hypothetical protein